MKKQPIDREENTSAMRKKILDLVRNYGEIVCRREPFKPGETRIS